MLRSATLGTLASRRHLEVATLHCVLSSRKEAGRKATGAGPKLLFCNQPTLLALWECMSIFLTCQFPGTQHGFRNHEEAQALCKCKIVCLFGEFFFCSLLLKLLPPVLMHSCSSHCYIHKCNYLLLFCS